MDLHCRNHNFKIMMDSVQKCAITSIMRKEVELDTLSKWIKSIGFLILLINQYFRIKRQASVCLLFMTNMVYLASKAYTTIVVVR
jgi:hypothetical protein